MLKSFAGRTSQYFLTEITANIHARYLRQGKGEEGRDAWPKVQQFHRNLQAMAYFPP